MSDRNAAGKVGTADGGLGTGGSADGGAMGDAEGIIFANGISDYAMIG